MKPIWLLVRAVVLLAAARVLLARTTTTATLRRLARPRSTAGHGDPNQALIAVRRAGRLVGGVCLPQAVALTALLQRDGYAPALILACARMPAERSWSAHAWVQLDDSVLEPIVSRGHTPLAWLRAADGWVPSGIPSQL